ncbi:MAG: NAD(P)/FAD-dependent oxidoreductase [Adhaeribacter sp.]
MIYDFILVGHGLAGAILGHTLSGRGHKILVIDQPKENSASRVAAGLMNPLAGKRFAKSWLADTLVPQATAFYRQLEQQAGCRLFHQKPILKLFSSIEEQNTWMGKSAGRPYGDFIAAVHTSLPASEEIYQQEGGIEIARGGYVDVPLLLDTLRRLREERGEIIPSRFDFGQLRIQENMVTYGDFKAQNLIFCEGYQGAVNPFFSWLPFSLNKGEVLDIETDLLQQAYIYNKAVYVVGLQANRWRVGATYNWRQVSEEITQEAREELCRKLQGLLKRPFRVVSQRAGIRPPVRDRRPLLGRHPGQPVLGIFNGMGSKGVMMAPYLAGHFEAYLTGQQDLLPEVNILRYLSFYKELTPR